MALLEFAEGMYFLEGVMKLFVGALIGVLMAGCVPSVERQFQPAQVDVTAAQEEREKQRAEWQVAREQLNLIKESNLDGMRKCKHTFEIMWQLAKEGNYDARDNLYTALEQKWIIFQGFEVTRRDLDILYLHSLAVPGAPRNALSRTIQQLPYLGSIRADSVPAYRQCMLEKPSQECADILVRAGRMPSFEEWAKSFDQRLSRTIVGCVAFARRAGE